MCDVGYMRGVEWEKGTSNTVEWDEKTGDTIVSDIPNVSVNITFNPTEFTQNPVYYCFYCGFALKQRRSRLFECEECGRLYLIEGDVIRVIL